MTVSPDLTTDLEAALTRRVGETLGLARRAGQAMFGFTKAREWLDAGRAGVVLQASDGSPEERQRFLGGWAGRVPVVAPLDGARLGGIFGRDHVVHVVVLRGRLADRLHAEAERLAGVQTASPTEGDKSGGARRRDNKSANLATGNPAATDAGTISPSGVAGRE